MSSSILTNMSAISALQNLEATQSALATTQNQISSGLRVANASDNAAYWSIATTMRSDVSALSSVSDALNLGNSVVATATAAVNATLTIMNKLKADLVTAQAAGADASQVQTDIAAQQKSLVDILGSASFNGVNLLDSSAGQASGGVNVVASFSRSGTGSSATTSVGFINIATETAAGAGGTALTGSAGILSTDITNGGTALTAAGTAGTAASNGAASGNSGIYSANSLLGFTVVGQSASDLTAIATAIDTAISNITASGAALGTAGTQISNQSTFVSALSDAITSGVGSLVDADLNEASIRLNALQTQQQLGVQSLSIANQNSQLILKLFQ